MASERTDRDLESREKTTRVSDEWVNPSLLPMPNKVEGWRFKWIRVASRGKDDVRNVSKSLREGWVPVNAVDHPELELKSADARWPDGVEIGGLLLCKMPEEVALSRQRQLADLNRRTKDTVDHGFMNEEDPRMRKFNESKSRNEFRRG